jgi:threonine aldolase
MRTPPAIEGRVIDLRSDTVTRPSPGMRAAIAAAEVGDDTLGDDPTVQRLEQHVASLLGKEAALFFPGGVMANQVALMLLAEPGSEVIVEAGAHIFDWEMGAAAALGGIQLRPVPTSDGLLDATLVAGALRSGSAYQPRTAAIALENTHNGAGGRVLPLAAMRAIRALANERGVAVHLDGARLWNAAVASGTAEAEYAAHADTVMVTLSKGLGCPVGSLLAADGERIARARALRRRLGGSMRQAGILAAAGLYALEHHRGLLAADHRRARRLAERLSDVRAARVTGPETNIIMIELLGDRAAADAFVRAAAAHDVLVVPFSMTRVRAVTHLDIDDASIERAADVLHSLLCND